MHMSHDINADGTRKGQGPHLHEAIWLNCDFCPIQAIPWMVQ
jgi:hypothetical protein